jgi:hypothetical protein
MALNENSINAAEYSAQREKKNPCRQNRPKRFPRRQLERHSERKNCNHNKHGTAKQTQQLPDAFHA